MIQRFLKNSFIRSSFIFTAANFLVSLIAYIDNLLVARTFTLADYGEYMTAISYLIFLGVPLTALGMVVVERIGRVAVEDREEVALSIEHWLEAQLIKLSPVLLLVSLVLAGGMYFKGNMSVMAIAFVLVCSFLGIFINFYSSVLQSYKTFWFVGVFSTLGSLVKLLFYVLVVFIRPQLFWLFSAYIVSTFVTTALGRYMIRKNVSVKKFKITFGQVHTYLRRKSILIPLFTTLGIVGLSNVDIVLVKKFFDSDTVGLYSSLSVLGKIIFYLVTPVSAVGFTFFTGSDTKNQSAKILTLLTFFIALFGLGSTLFYALFPAFVVNLIFGAKFLSVSHLIWLSALFGTTYSLMYLYSQYFVAQRSRFALLGIFAVVLQIIGIYIAHDSLYEVLLVNISINTGLVLVYVTQFIRKEFLLKA